VIHLDTCVLIGALTGRRRSAPTLRGLIERGERVSFSALVLYEWQRGPRHPDELAAQEALFPSTDTAAFDPSCAAIAARLYRQLPRPKGREIDLAIAACAIAHEATFWTLNPDDFSDIPGLQLFPG
jgi:predicted nucleic acid-binding protein